MSLPPPVVKQRSDVQVTADLQRKTRALELRKEEHEALQLKLVAAQDGVNKKAQQILCLEEDILELKKSLFAFPATQMDEAEPAGVIMPEAKEIQSVIAIVRTAMLHQDLDLHYETYVAGEKAANRSPLGQFGWLRLVTANELAVCEKALEAIQARKDESERPRKKAARHDAEATA